MLNRDIEAESLLGVENGPEVPASSSIHLFILNKNLRDTFYRAKTL